MYHVPYIPTGEPVPVYYPVLRDQYYVVINGVEVASAATPEEAIDRAMSALIASGDKTPLADLSLRLRFRLA